MDDDLDIYQDLDEFQEQQEQKSKELQNVEDKYQQSLETIRKLEEENKTLRKKIQRIELSFQSLLDTARSEIKRKDAEIERLRKEKDDICFRRKFATRTNDSHITEGEGDRRRSSVEKRHNEDEAKQTGRSQFSHKEDRRRHHTEESYDSDHKHKESTKDFRNRSKDRDQYAPKREYHSTKTDEVKKGSSNNDYKSRYNDHHRHRDAEKGKHIEERHEHRRERYDRDARSRERERSRNDQRHASYKLSDRDKSCNRKSSHSDERYERSDNNNSSQRSTKLKSTSHLHSIDGGKNPMCELEKKSHTPSNTITDTSDNTVKIVETKSYCENSIAKEFRKDKCDPKGQEESNRIEAVKCDYGSKIKQKDDNTSDRNNVDLSNRISMEINHKTKISIDKRKETPKANQEKEEDIGKCLYEDCDIISNDGPETNNNNLHLNDTNKQNTDYQTQTMQSQSQPKHQALLKIQTPTKVALFDALFGASPSSMATSDNDYQMKFPSDGTESITTSPSQYNDDDEGIRVENTVSDKSLRGHSKPPLKLPAIDLTQEMDVQIVEENLPEQTNSEDLAKNNENNNKINETDSPKSPSISKEYIPGLDLITGPDIIIPSHSNDVHNTKNQEKFSSKTETLTEKEVTIIQEIKDQYKLLELGETCSLDKPLKESAIKNICNLPILSTDVMECLSKSSILEILQRANDITANETLISLCPDSKYPKVTSVPKEQQNSRNSRSATIPAASSNIVDNTKSSCEVLPLSGQNELLDLPINSQKIHSKALEPESEIVEILTAYKKIDELVEKMSTAKSNTQNSNTIEKSLDKVAVLGSISQESIREGPKYGSTSSTIDICLLQKFNDQRPAGNISPLNSKNIPCLDLTSSPETQSASETAEADAKQAWGTQENRNLDSTEHAADIEVEYRSKFIAPRNIQHCPDIVFRSPKRPVTSLVFDLTSPDSHKNDDCFDKSPVIRENTKDQNIPDVDQSRESSVFSSSDTNEVDTGTNNVGKMISVAEDNQSIPTNQTWPNSSNKIFSDNDALVLDQDKTSPDTQSTTIQSSDDNETETINVVPDHDNNGIEVNCNITDKEDETQTKLTNITKSLGNIAPEESHNKCPAENADEACVKIHKSLTDELHLSNNEKDSNHENKLKDTPEMNGVKSPQADVSKSRITANSKNTEIVNFSETGNFINDETEIEIIDKLESNESKEETQNVYKEKKTEDVELMSKIISTETDIIEKEVEMDIKKSYSCQENVDGKNIQSNPPNVLNNNSSILREEGNKYQTINVLEADVEDFNKQNSDVRHPEISTKNRDNENVNSTTKDVTEAIGIDSISKKLCPAVEPENKDDFLMEDYLKFPNNKEQTDILTNNGNANIESSKNLANIAKQKETENIDNAVPSKKNLATGLEMLFEENKNPNIPPSRENIAENKGFENRDNMSNSSSTVLSTKQAIMENKEIIFVEDLSKDEDPSEMELPTKVTEEVTSNEETPTTEATVSENASKILENKDQNINTEKISYPDLAISAKNSNTLEIQSSDISEKDSDSDALVISEEVQRSYHEDEKIVSNPIDDINPEDDFCLNEDICESKKVSNNIKGHLELDQQVSTSENKLESHSKELCCGISPDKNSNTLKVAGRLQDNFLVPTENKPNGQQNNVISPNLAQNSPKALSSTKQEDTENSNLNKSSEHITLLSIKTNEELKTRIIQNTKDADNLSSLKPILNSTLLTSKDMVPRKTTMHTSLEALSLIDTYNRPSILPSISISSPTPSNFSGIFSKKKYDSCDDICMKNKRKSPKLKEYILPAASVLCTMDNLENASKRPMAATLNKKLHWELLKNKNEMSEVEDDTDAVNSTDEEDIKNEDEGNKNDFPNTVLAKTKVRNSGDLIVKKSIIARRNTIDIVPMAITYYKNVEDIEKISSANISHNLEDESPHRKQSSPLLVPEKLSEKSKPKQPIKRSFLQKQKLSPSPPSKDKCKANIRTQKIVSGEKITKSKKSKISIHEKQQKSNIVGDILSSNLQNKLVIQNSNVESPFPIISNTVRGNLPKIDLIQTQISRDEVQKSVRPIPSMAESCNYFKEKISQLPPSTLVTNEIDREDPQNVNTGEHISEGISTEEQNASISSDPQFKTPPKLLNEDNSHANNINNKKELDQNTTKVNDSLDTSEVYDKEHSSDEHNSSWAENSEPECNKYLKDAEEGITNVSPDLNNISNSECQNPQRKETNEIDCIAKLDKSLKTNYKIPKLKKTSNETKSKSNNRKKKEVSLEEIGVHVRPFKASLSTFRIPKIGQSLNAAKENADECLGNAKPGAESIKEGLQMVEEERIYSSEREQSSEKGSLIKRPTKVNTVSITSRRKSVNIQRQSNDFSNDDDPLVDHMGKNSPERKLNTRETLNPKSTIGKKPVRRKSMYVESCSAQELMDSLPMSNDYVPSMKDMSSSNSNQFEKPVKSRRKSMCIENDTLNNSITTKDKKSHDKAKPTRRKSMYVENKNFQDLDEDRGNDKYLKIDNNRNLVGEKLNQTITVSQDDGVNKTGNIKDMEKNLEKTKPTKMRRKSMYVENVTLDKVDTDNEQKVAKEFVKKSIANRRKSMYSEIPNEENEDYEDNIPLNQLRNRSKSLFIENVSSNTPDVNNAGINETIRLKNCSNLPDGKVVKKQNSKDPRSNVIDYKKLTTPNRDSNEITPNIKTTLSTEENVNAKKKKPIRSRSKSLYCENSNIKESFEIKESNENNPNSQIANVNVSNTVTINNYEKNGKSTNTILESSCDGARSIHIAPTVIENIETSCPTAPIEPAVKPVKNKRKRRVIKILGTSYDDPHIAKKFKESKEDVTSSPASPNLYHPIFHTQVRDESQPDINYLTPLSHDDRFKEIDANMQDMFYSPQHEAGAFKSGNHQTLDTSFATLPATSLNDTRNNLTIDETVNTNREENIHTTEELQSTTSVNTSTTSSLNHTDSTKHVTLGSSEYRFEKVSENVVNLFISRKKKRKRTT
ncbi:FLICE-associated huge protein isoform X2 [Haematobia irritans]|uniref:FLICE-associated huge protein isoform X2 n=1 Tax=Haematobia irritans TaxID=7368 RepID=UPI003F5048C9